MVLFKNEIKFDADNYCITIPGKNGKDVTISVFDKVVVNVSVEKDKNTQRGTVKMNLVQPIDSSGL